MGNKLPAETRPFTSDKTPDEWQAERSVYNGQFKGSTAWLDPMKDFDRNRAHRDVLERRRERRIREEEDAWQIEHADEIRAENEAEARRLADACCKVCFCLHGGSCE